MNQNYLLIKLLLSSNLSILYLYICICSYSMPVCKHTVCGQKLIWISTNLSGPCEEPWNVNCSEKAFLRENTHSHCSINLQHLSACRLTHSLSFLLILCVCVFCISIIQQQGWGRRSCRAHHAGSAETNSRAGWRFYRFWCSWCSRHCAAFSFVACKLPLKQHRATQSTERQKNEANITILARISSDCCCKDFFDVASRIWPESNSLHVYTYLANGADSDQYLLGWRSQQ